MPELVIRREAGVGWIVFSNVTHRNAVTYEMWRALPPALDALGADPEIRFVVICGDGNEAFVSGGDISEFETVRATAEKDAEYMRVVDEACLSPVRCAKPVIAKIRGVCFGGGLAVAAACDVRIAADDSVFRMPAARLGVGYWFNGVQRLVQVLGASNTADIFFSARVFDARDAARMGLLNRVVPAAELDREVQAYCDQVLQNAPLTLVAAKAAIRAALEDPSARDMKALEALARGCWASADYREGRDAFMQKRKPQFKGR